MAPRTSWKGFLKLSLISVPVRAYTAHDTGGEIRLNQLHAECHSRVKYKKVCPEHGELSSDEIVSGYEYAKDQYVIIDPEELARLRPESDKSVRIDGFVGPEHIDPVYLAGKTYYLLPDGPAGHRPYALLHKGMDDNEVCAVARVVIAGREQLVMLRTAGPLLAMSVLNVAKRIKAVGQFSDELEEQDMTAEELSLTNTLIQASVLEDFAFERYEDEFSERLMELIEKKVAGEEIVQAPDREEPKIINLMDALKKSVANAQAASPQADGAKAGKAGRKLAPSAAPRKKAARRKKSG